LSKEERERPGLSVKTLFLENKKRLKLELISGKGSFQKQISEKDLNRPGLALTGFVDLFTFKRVQICGNTEIAYLKSLSSDLRKKALSKVFAFDIPCFVITNGNEVSPEFVELSDKYKISTFRTPFATTKVTQLLGDYLDEKFAPRTFIHGSLVDVYGIGVLITGRSGIGKSEIALDLVAKGHRLVTDDVVTIVRRTGGILIGTGNETLKHNMEIRGVGVIDVRAVFGIRGIRGQKRIEIEVELVDWDSSEKYERLGLEDITTDILGEKIPLIKLPVYPGKNISVIVEVIALNQLLKIYGYHAAKEFEERLTQRINAKLKVTKDYRGRDFE